MNVNWKIMKQKKYSAIHLFFAIILSVAVTATYISHNPYENMNDCISDQKMKIILSNSTIEMYNASTVARGYCKSNYFRIVYK